MPLLPWQQRLQVLEVVQLADEGDSDLTDRREGRLAATDPHPAEVVDQVDIDAVRA